MYVNVPAPYFSLRQIFPLHHAYYLILDVTCISYTHTCYTHHMQVYKARPANAQWFVSFFFFPFLFLFFSFYVTFSAMATCHSQRSSASRFTEHFDRPASSSLLSLASSTHALSVASPSSLLLPPSLCSLLPETPHTAQHPSSPSFDSSRHPPSLASYASSDLSFIHVQADDIHPTFPKEPVSATQPTRRKWRKVWNFMTARIKKASQRRLSVRAGP